MMTPLHTVEELEERLSRPTPGVLETLRSLSGDLVILGAGGKMGPTLARMARRALDQLEQPTRRVIAVSRFATPPARKSLEQHGVETLACDLADRDAVAKLPEAPLVIFMAGQKFGTSAAPERTWVMNTLVPAIVAERFARSRLVVFSTGCVYPLVPVAGPGAREEHPLGPPGEYASSCVGRERIFTHFANRFGTPLVLFRLCYAIDLRYGVLCDLVQQVAHGRPVDLEMGATHVIWQGDANARAIQSLALAATPPLPLNVTGLERIPIRWLAEQIGARLGRPPAFSGQPSPTAWLWDASRSYELFGPPTVSLEEMLDATVAWHQQGGAILGKPTHFESTSGQF